MLSKLKKVNFKIVTYKTLIFCFCFLLAIIVSISLYTHNDFDPSIFTVNDDPPLNALGFFGANISSLLLVIFMASDAPLSFCFSQTFNCKLLADINAISELENKIENKRPTKEIINSMFIG